VPSSGDVFESYCPQGLIALLLKATASISLALKVLFTKAMTSGRLVQTQVRKREPGAHNLLKKDDF
jgi:hypothetical protein